MLTHRLSLLACMTSMLVIAPPLTVRAATTGSPTTNTTEVTTSTIMLNPADYRTSIPAEAFAKTKPGEWVSPEVKPAFPFDELIYAWNAPLPDGQGFRIHLQVTFSPGDQSPWLYAGFWGAVKDPVTSRSKPVFDRGEVDMDWLKMKERALSYRFKVVEASTAPLTVLPSLSVITTDNNPSREVAALALNSETTAALTPPILDLPFRRQMNSKGVVTPNRCQSAALATALQYFGNEVPLENIVGRIHDPEYNYPGLWPRIVAAASEFGCDSTIGRFRDWDAVKAALARNEVILCSIRMKEGECKDPPYGKMGNHIVALNGLTDDGRVIVTDSFLAKSGRGYRCQWHQEDFERIWMKTKQGVAMVILPPKGATRKTISELPAFPTGREPITGDDH
ncbi:MAG: C39 family peptidase [Candidatus Sumerlaeaceae bacterium]|nr:C39 family peptidase [Candidatus Sumerlaeaceae bacterium]